MQFEHKVYGTSITMDAMKAADYIGSIHEIIKQKKDCSKAELNYTLSVAVFNGNGQYKKYRRGKNRCIHCGLYKHDNESFIDGN